MTEETRTWRRFFRRTPASGDAVLEGPGAGSPDVAGTPAVTAAAPVEVGPSIAVDIPESDPLLAYLQ